MAHFGCAAHKSFDLSGSIEERVLGVAVEVAELRHRRWGRRGGDALARKRDGGGAATDVEKLVEVRKRGDDNVPSARGTCRASWRNLQPEGIFVHRPPSTVHRPPSTVHRPCCSSISILTTSAIRCFSRSSPATSRTEEAGHCWVHGSGEAGERALEATGAMVRERDGVWDVETPEQAAVVERATRELNRQIVHELNEAGVPAVRVMGADRGLLRVEGGAVVAGSTNWLVTLVAQGVVGVLATLVSSDGNALVEVEPMAAVGALAKALDAAPVVLLETGSGSDRQAEDGRRMERLGALSVEVSRVRRADLRTFSKP